MRHLLLIPPRRVDGYIGIWIEKLVLVIDRDTYRGCVHYQAEAALRQIRYWAATVR